MKVVFKTALSCLLVVTISMVACEKKAHIYAAAVIIPDSTYTMLANKVLLVSKINHKKQIATLSVESSNLINTQTVGLDILTFFDTESEAKVFIKNFRSYLNTHIVSHASMILRAQPNFDALKLAVVAPNTKLPIVHYLKTPESRLSISGAPSNTIETDSSEDKKLTSYLDNEGYWVQAQYYTDENSNNYIRGWVFITEDTSIIFSNDNVANASMMPRAFKGIENWMTIKALSYVSQGLGVPVQYDHTLILEPIENTDKPFITLLHEDSLSNVHYSELWPMNDNTAIIPYKGMTLSWNIERKEISVRYPGDIQYTFVPTTEPLFSTKLEKTQDISYYYHYLSRSPLDRNSNTVTWYSNIYGRILFSAISGKYQIEMDWYVTPEIASLYFPAGTTRVKGIVSFTHILAHNIARDTDIVLTVYDVDQKKNFFLALIEVSDTEMSLQFIPEADVLTDTKKETIITAPPVDPRMIFEK